MPTVFAAVFHPNTLNNLLTEKADARMAQMKVAIQQAHSALSCYASSMGATNPFYIFTAPEYYFVKSATAAKGRTVWVLYTAAEKDQIFEELRALSGKYPRFLLAPGTLAWSRPRAKPQGARTLDGWSTAPIFYQGKLKHEYDKIMDDTLFRINTEDVVFQKGTKSQLFNVESLNFGIEVCGDLDEGNLSKAARPQSLDFEIMLSATIRHGFNEAEIVKVPVKDGGYLIHADSEVSGFCGAWCVKRGSGSHGFAPGPSDTNFYDPWTGKEIKDSVGAFLSAGTVLAVAPITRMQKGKCYKTVNLLSQETQFRLEVTAEPVAPFLDNNTGSYHVEATATLCEENQAALPNRQIYFQVNNGKLLRWHSPSTNVGGLAKVLVSGEKNKPLSISAIFEGVTVTCETKIDSPGSGNVNKIARLQPETVIDLWSYYLPI